MVICPWNMDHLVNGLLKNYSREKFLGMCLCGRKKGNKYKAGFWKQKSIPEAPCQETRCRHKTLFIVSQSHNPQLDRMSLQLSLALARGKRETLSQLSLVPSAHQHFLALLTCGHPDLTMIMHINQGRCRNGVSLSKFGLSQSKFCDGQMLPNSILFSQLYFLLGDRNNLCDGVSVVLSELLTNKFYSRAELFPAAASVNKHCWGLSHQDSSVSTTLVCGL